MPSWELFERQSTEYKSAIFPREVRARLAVEAAASLGWSKYIGPDGDTVTHDEYGASAPYKDVLKHFGFTVENVVAKARELIKKTKP